MSQALWNKMKEAAFHFDGSFFCCCFSSFDFKCSVLLCCCCGWLFRTAFYCVKHAHTRHAMQCLRCCIVDAHQTPHGRDKDHCVCVRLTVNRVRCMPFACGLSPALLSHTHITNNCDGFMIGLLNRTHTHIHLPPENVKLDDDFVFAYPPIEDYEPSQTVIHMKLRV